MSDLGERIHAGEEGVGGHTIRPVPSTANLRAREADILTPKEDGEVILKRKEGR